MKLIFDSREQVIDWCRQHLSDTETQYLNSDKVYVYDMFGTFWGTCDNVMHAAKITKLSDDKVLQGLKTEDLVEGKYYFTRSRFWRPRTQLTKVVVGW